MQQKTHPTPTFGEVRFYLSDGTRRVFASMAQALRELGLRWIEANVGAQFCEYAGRELVAAHYLSRCKSLWKILYRGHAAICRDAEGKILLPEDFAAEQRRLLRLRRHSAWAGFRWGFWNGEGPVPFTGKHRGGSWQRAPATTAEKRLAVVVDDEPGPRPSRRPHKLVNAWDDVPRTNQRSWKEHRTTQYRVRCI